MAWRLIDPSYPWIRGCKPRFLKSQMLFTLPIRIAHSNKTCAARNPHEHRLALCSLCTTAKRTQLFGLSCCPVSFLWSLMLLMLMDSHLTLRKEDREDVSLFCEVLLMFLWQPSSLLATALLACLLACFSSFSPNTPPLSLILQSR